jgi:CxxC motif-containing protein (DUF1111 family)
MRAPGCFLRGEAIALVLLTTGAGGCADEPAAIAPGGATTIVDRSSHAFQTPAANLGAAALARHRAGDAGFEATFVTAPAPVHAGLGPRYNHSSCAGCHPRDGRGLATFGASASMALVRVSLADGMPDVPGGPVPVPELGTQLQDHAVFGVEPEIAVELGWEEIVGAYADGTPFVLRAPRLALARPDGTPLPPTILRSFRQAPAVFGLGLLEAIPDEDLEAAADPDDADGDGISGRVNRVWDASTGTVRNGRFGHKASMPGLIQQATGAYAADLGVTSALGGAEAEITDDVVADTAFYTATLAVPARAPADVAEGEALFARLRCDGCHTPIATTGAHAIAAVAGQTIAPYTDLLLHDLGDGLADGRPDYAADGREWRTPPLWGLGLVQTVLPGAGFLHDGRARTIAEAILWHDGEASAARDGFVRANAGERAALLRFLQAL